MNVKQKDTVFVVDDGPAMRESLRWLLEAVGLSVESYASPEVFLESFDPSKPGCLLLDVKMPTMSGLDVQHELNRRGVQTPIVFLTAYGDVPLAVRACKAGAMDFIEKPFSDQVLLRAIRGALAKDRLIRRERTEDAEFSNRTDLLTVRERQVMTRVIAGRTNRDIARELGLSPRTIEVHRGHLMSKLEVESVADLVRLGLRNSVLAPVQPRAPTRRAPGPATGNKRPGRERLGKPARRVSR